MDEKDRELQKLRRQVESIKVESIKVESIKVEPARRGQWLEGTRTVRVYTCSVCGWEMDYKTDYCPHCGANMYELEGL